MCKYLGSFRGAQSVVPVLFGVWFSLAAIPAFLLFASTEAHAQVCMNVNLLDHRAKTISPLFWAPGQNYTVTFIDPAGEFYQGGHTQLYVFNQSEYVPGGPVLQEDPYVTVSPPVYLSPTLTSFGVSVAAGAPTEWDGFNFYLFSKWIRQWPVFHSDYAVCVECYADPHPHICATGDVDGRCGHEYHNYRHRLHPNE